MKIEDLYYDIPTDPVDIENWDIEKWREEKPMDYLKALHIINTYENSAEKMVAFEIIYHATRLYIPDVLYKYYSLVSDEEKNMQKFQTLNEGKVFTSSVNCFNDPFDGKGFFYNPNELADIERLKLHRGRVIDDFTTFTRATCLTANGVQSMPMWAHYSNNHAGFCVSYDMKANSSLSMHTFPVQYTNERLDITSLMRQQVLKYSHKIDMQSASGKQAIILDDVSLAYVVSLLCKIKHSSWSYEKEFRCVTASNEPGMPYVDARPKEIFIGMQCKPNHAMRLKEIGDSWGIPVYKMTFNECSETYCLVSEKY